MRGRTCAGTYVTGTGKDGKPRATYLYHVVDNEETMRRDGSQAVVWQTAINPVVALELLAAGVWEGTGRARAGGVRRRAVPRAPRRARRAARHRRAHAVRDRAEALLARELERFEAMHPRSRELAERARGSLLAGVPMHWMVRWPGRFPVFAAEAAGARVRDVDGIEYVDFCLGDTGAMTGHSPEPVVRALAEQAARGITLMLPSEDALWVGEELTRRFGPSRWQFALTATDANRFAIRLARLVTGRPKILVFNWCYHGTVDETFATLRDGAVVEREANLGPPVPLDETTRVVEWNDVDALERALAAG